MSQASTPLGQQTYKHPAAETASVYAVEVRPPHVLLPGELPPALLELTTSLQARIALCSGDMPAPGQLRVLAWIVKRGLLGRCAVLWTFKQIAGQA